MAGEGKGGVPGNSCPLCEALETEPCARTKRCVFFRCARCRLTFRERGAWPSRKAEKARYLLHRNDPADEGYVAFLGRLIEPLAKLLPAPAKGLDLGSGPTPVLRRLLEERGYEMRGHDPFFAPDEEALRRRYDFVTCCEVVEHMHEPGREMELLSRLVRPGGLLAVMTSLVDDSFDLSSWSYARDSTHVCFFHRETMAWIAGRFGWELEGPPGQVTLFRSLSGA